MQLQSPCKKDSGWSEGGARGRATVTEFGVMRTQTKEGQQSRSWKRQGIDFPLEPPKKITALPVL